MFHMIELVDLKDRKILFELEQDSRQSLSQIAKKVGLKKETVFHRMRSLEKRGIIKNYLTEINIYKLGFQFYPILIKFQNSTPQIEEDIFDYFKKSQFIAWLTKCEGFWDLNATIITKNNFELKIFLDEFLEKYSAYISDKHIFITTEIHYFKRGFWLGKKINQTVSTGGEPTIEPENSDIALLRILSTNARKPLVEIGRDLNLTAKNVAYKINKLKKNKIIQGSRILVDFSKIGYKFYKVWFTLQDITKQNFKMLMNYFQDHPNIIWATKFIGYYDLSIELEVKDTDEFREIINDVKQKFSKLIKKHESLLIFKETIMNYLPKN